MIHTDIVPDVAWFGLALTALGAAGAAARKALALFGTHVATKTRIELQVAQLVTDHAKVLAYIERHATAIAPIPDLARRIGQVEDAFARHRSDHAELREDVAEIRAHVRWKSLPAAEEVPG